MELDLKALPPSDPVPIKLPDPRPRKSQLPKLLVFEAGRIYSFSDAVFSIVATVMVIPLRLSNSEQDELRYPKGQFLLTDWLTSWKFIHSFLTYLFVYFIVIHSWYLHNKFTKMVELFDDILAWLNLLYLLAVSFLPAAVSMTYFFPASVVVLTINICNILLVNLIMFIMTVIALQQKVFLHRHLLNSQDYIYSKVILYFPLIVSCLLGSVAIVLAWTTNAFIGYTAFFTMAIIPPAINMTLSVLDRKFAKGRVNKELRMLLVHNVVSLNRFVAFSDGVFSIVATLIVLNIATSAIPQKASESHGNPTVFFKESGDDIISYLATFFTVGLLWFVHHSMVQHFKVVSGWLTVFNSLSLFFIGLVPLGSQLISQFQESIATVNIATSIQLYSILLMLASVSQLLLWTVVQYNRMKYLKYCNTSPHVEVVMLVKLLIFPTLGFVFYVISFSESIIVYDFFIYSSLVTPLLFVMPRLVIMIKSSLERFDIPNPFKSCHCSAASSHTDHEDNNNVSENNSSIQVTSVKSSQTIEQDQITETAV